MSLRRERPDDEDEALETVRFLGVKAEGVALVGSYVGWRSIVLV